MEHLKELQAVYEKERGKLLDQPGVTGTDIGFKYVKGRKTDEVVIRVFVEKKRDDVPEKERVPSTIRGMRTDVIEAVFEEHAPVVAEEEEVHQASSVTVDKSTYNPMIGGVSVGPSRTIGGRIYAGTLGCPVQQTSDRGRPLIMSNYHVLCKDNNWTSDKGVCQPSRVDGGSASGDKIGNIIKGVYSNRVDGAVATSTARPVYPYIEEIGSIRGTHNATLGSTIRKRGRTTGLTYGTVDGINGVTSVSGTGHRFENQIIVYADEKKSALWSEGGDSGSVYVNSDNEVIGLHWGGSSDGQRGVANAIADVENELDIEVFAINQTTPITDVKILFDNEATPAGYSKIPFDLNKSAGGKYIYLAYKRGGKDSITDFYVISGGSSSISAPTGFTKINRDLNKGAGGDYIYLCYKKNGTNPPVLDVNVLQAKSTADVHPAPGWTKVGMDLNKGAGGYYQYICYRWSDATPITHLNVITGGSSNREPSPEWARLPGDTNDTAGGDYVYFAYDKKPGTDPITNVIIVYNNDSVPSGYAKINVDLNKGAGGDYVYACYTRSKRFAPIKDLWLVYGSKDVDPPAGFVRIPKDLNKGAGGKYCFLCYRK